MKLYNNINEVLNNFNKNVLMFSNKDTYNSFKHFIKNNVSFGNLTNNLHYNNVPVIIIDLSPKFNIPSDKYTESNNILHKIIKQSNILPYVTYVYKNPIVKKTIVSDSEYSYNNIKSTSDELIYIINNIYKKYDNILCINMGKYVEYQYLFNIINNCNNSNITIHNIFNHHISQFIKNTDDSTETILNDDIDRIKKKILCINNSET